MKVLCAISGITYNVDHISYSLHSRESCHPVFDIPQKQLFPLAMRYITDTNSYSLQQNKIDMYLVFLAVLASTKLVEFRVPTIYTADTASIVANNLESLIKVVSSINLIKSPSIELAKFCITPETKTLENVKYWIEIWEENLREFYKSSEDKSLLADIIRREQILERYILSAHIELKKYSQSLANWAALSGNFPTFTVRCMFGEMELADYWKTIIIKLADGKATYSIPKKDIIELREHCIDNIMMGNLASSKLIQLLNDSINEQDNFFGATDFTILDGNTPSTSNVELANMQNIINTAPSVQPTPDMYATKTQYVVAKLKWDMSQQFAPSHIPQPVSSSNSYDGEF
jgi:hypothetical protein